MALATGLITQGTSEPGFSAARRTGKAEILRLPKPTKAPRGESIHLPLTQVLRDMDFFGGEADRPPWAEQMRYGSTDALREGKFAHERGSSE